MPLWILRHGRSLANEAEIVVSTLANGVLPRYTLAPAGVEQAAAAGRALAAQLPATGMTPADVRFVASPFSRTLATARTAAAQLGLGDDVVQPEEALRERFFGSPAELGPHRCGRNLWLCETSWALTRVHLPRSAYEGVWAADTLDAHSHPGGDGESVHEVADRLRAALLRHVGGLTASHAERAALVLVAHGDTLQILQAVLANAADDADGAAAEERLRTHRRYGMATGELRRIW